VKSHTTIIIPFDNRVIFLRLLNRAKFSSRLSGVAQALDLRSYISQIGTDYSQLLGITNNSENASPAPD
jgi:hypothetical protein